MLSATNTSNKKTKDSCIALDKGISARPDAQPGYRFRNSNRLTDARSFGRVFAEAQRTRDPLFTVLSRENGKYTARLGLAISKKHCRHATGRNRLKRLVRESFRQHSAELAGLDIVVLGQPAASGADNQAIFDSLARHWQKTRSAHR